MQPPRRSLSQRFRHQVRTRVWKQDIHKSAWIAGTASIDRTYPKGIHIGEHCVIEEYATVLAHDMSRALYLDTHIRNRAHIGTRAIIMPGITVGEGAIVDPGSVVTRDVEPGARVRGNPAKPV